MQCRPGKPPGRETASRNAKTGTLTLMTAQVSYRRDAAGSQNDVRARPSSIYRVAALCDISNKAARSIFASPGI
jgi:hypothetical protein